MGCGASASRVVPGGGSAVLDDAALPCDAKALRTLVASVGGLAPHLRPSAWPVLLGAQANEEVRRAAQDAEFARLLAAATEPGTVSDEHVKVIDADVPRTDRSLDTWADDASLAPLRDLLVAHLAYAPNVGYYQGMNDASAIFLATLSTTADAFWAFEGWLRSTAANWVTQLDGVWLQARGVMRVLEAADPRLAKRLASLSIVQEQPLPFLFAGARQHYAHEHTCPPALSARHRVTRGIALIRDPHSAIFLRLKREMRSYEETRRLWEVSWAIGGSFELLAIAAHVLGHRKQIVRACRGRDGCAAVHKIFTDAAGTLEAAPLLAGARRLHRLPRVRAALEDVNAELAGYQQQLPEPSPGLGC